MRVPNSGARRWLGAVLVVVAAVTAQAAAADARSAHQWLQRMVSAMQETDYTGVFVYRQGASTPESMRIVHRGGEAVDEVEERLHSLDGVAREIIRDGNRVTCILPDSRSVMVDHRQVRNPLTSVLPADTDSIGRYYRLDTGGVTRVAGREAQRIRIEAADDYRYGYRFWIDTGTGVMLRADLVHGDDTLEQVVFTEIQFPDDIPDKLLEPHLSGRDFTWYKADPDGEEHDGQKKVFEPDWHLGFIPGGFALRLSERRHMPTGIEGPVEHRMYSDGLAAVSVYVSHLDSKLPRFEGLSRMGAFSAFGRVSDERQVVVVGEVPPRAVMEIARSFAPGAPSK